MSLNSNAHIVKILTELAEIGGIDSQRLIQKQEFGPRESIFHLGDKRKCFFIVRKGRTRTYMVSASGHEITTGIWTEGATLGLISSIASIPRVLSCEAIDRCTVDMVDIVRFETLMEAHPTLAIAMSKTMAETAASAITRASYFALHSAMGRLIKVLLTLGRHEAYGPDNDQAMIRDLSKEDIARIANASRPWISQSISHLQSEGLLESRRMEIHIPSLSRLEKYCDLVCD
ncbi:Crp/Fnr family transcriptional regulator [Hoeflea sp. CAU 1731]